MTRAEKIAHNKAEKRIEAAYSARCQRVQISIMDIPKVFQYGHQAVKDGLTDAELADAIAAYVETIRCN